MQRLREDANHDGVIDERDDIDDPPLANADAKVSPRERLRRVARFAALPHWDCVSFITKSNDDLRQEVFW